MATGKSWNIIRALFGSNPLVQACLHARRGGLVIPILEGVSLVNLKNLPTTAYPIITLEEYVLPIHSLLCLII